MYIEWILIGIMVAALVPMLLHLLLLSSTISRGGVDNVYDTYIVLGNKPKGGYASYDMRIRMKHLIAIMKVHRINKFKIILSGSGKEPALMLLILKEHFDVEHLAEYDIVQDNSSSNTIKSIQYLKNNDITNCAIITSDYHICRTKLICNKLEYNCTIIPATDEKARFMQFILEGYFLILTFIFPVSVLQMFSKVRIKLHLK